MTTTTSAYHIDVQGDVLRVGFGEPAHNTQIVRDVESRIDELVQSSELTGGPLVKINGPASLPVMVVLAHRLTHLFGAVAVFDPKLGGYVVSATHNPDYKVGDLVK